MKHTEYGFRINQITEGHGPHWVFLPGGPGLGSEYLIDFCQKLQLPGSILLVDFPMDGTNHHGKLDFNHWQEGLVDLLKSYDKPILVAHSFSAMFVMSMPHIENYLSGLVIMNSTTSNTFFPHVNAMHLKHQLPDLVPAASQYHLEPSDETYRLFWDSYKHYCFTQSEQHEAEKVLPLFAFNNTSYHHAISEFYPTYECRLQLSSIPAMTITSEHDYICPPDIFTRDEQFQAPNIVNHVIQNAGHCPWVSELQQVQECFNAFIARVVTRPAV